MSGSFIIDDLTVFLDPEEFADSAMLGWDAVVGQFHEAYELASVGAYGMATTAPSFALPSTSVPANVVGMAFDRSGIRYTVRGTEPGSSGVTVLILAVA